MPTILAPGGNLEGDWICGGLVVVLGVIVGGYKNILAKGSIGGSVPLFVIILNNMTIQFIQLFSKHSSLEKLKQEKRPYFNNA